ncbi:MAG: hypothetical protein ACAI43_13345 [Phycisphaerae bacterium]
MTAVALGLGVLSYLTTGVTWDGGFPSGEIRIDVRDAAGQPVHGAKLAVYRGGTPQLADGYPIANHTAGAELISDEAGRIVAVQERGGIQFGGHYWELFWCIPIGRHTGPRFDCEITAPGYPPVAFGLRRLFESPHTGYEKFPKTRRVINGKEEELKVFHQTFTLGR